MSLLPIPFSFDPFSCLFSSSITMSPTLDVADYVDDYVRNDESTVVGCLEKFVRVVNEIFASEYLRRPNNNDIERLIQVGEARDFPGTLVPLIVCSANEKIVWLHGKTSFLEVQTTILTLKYIMVHIPILQHTCKEIFPSLFFLQSPPRKILEKPFY